MERGDSVKQPAHLVCPKCRYEFEYDGARFDDQIKQLGHDIQAINNQFPRKKLEMGAGTPEYKRWARRASDAIRHKQEELARLKAIRKTADAKAKETQLTVFAQIVRDSVPLETYVAWQEQAENLVRYRTYDTAIQRHNNFANA